MATVNSIPQPENDNPKNWRDIDTPDTKLKLPCFDLPIKHYDRVVEKHTYGDMTVCVYERVIQDACNRRWRFYFMVVYRNNGTVEAHGSAYGFSECQHPRPGGEAVSDDELPFERPTRPQMTPDTADDGRDILEQISRRVYARTWQTGGGL